MQIFSVNNTRELFRTICFISARDEALHWHTDNCPVFSLSASREYNKLCYRDYVNLASGMSSTLIHSQSYPRRWLRRQRRNAFSVFHFPRSPFALSPYELGKCMIRPLVELNRYFSCDKWNCFACGACHACGCSASLCGASSSFLPDRFKTFPGIKWDRKNALYDP